MTPAPREVREFPSARVGRRAFIFDELPSTNDAAAELALDPENIGCVVVAGHQTRGRGQHGRVWASRPGSSLLASVIVAPPPAWNRPVVLTAWAAVAVAETVRELANAQARIKWPNDLLVHGRKVCGILIEQTRATVVGIGLNLNQTAADFAAAELPDATSLALVGGTPIDPAAALACLVRNLDAEYSRLVAGEFVPVEADWKWRIGLLGRHVVADLTDGTAVAGRLHEMSFAGLELEVGDAGFRVIPPETVRHLRAV